MSPLDLLPAPFRTWGALAVAAALLTAGGAIGWTVNEWRCAAEVERLKNAYALETAQRVQRALDTLKAAQADRDALAAKLAAIDAQALDNFRRFEHENARLAAGAGAGRVIVRVPGAVCPRPADVPQAPAGSGVDSGAGAVLGPDARQRYFALRGALGHADEQLRACQDAVRALTGQGSP